MDTTGFATGCGILPTSGKQNLEYVLARAQEAKKLGFKFLLNFHYADSWADPLQQPVPKAWEGMNADQLSNAVFEYTRDTIAAFAKAGVLPDMVQVGNEIGNGMLWPLGKIRDWKSKETYPRNWDNFARFIYAGVNGVDAGRGNRPRPQIMIHVDHGGDIALTRWFFDKIRDYGIPYDTIGFSFYPWSHGTLPDLKANLNFAAAEYGKDVILVETGYQNRPGRYFKECPVRSPKLPRGREDWLEAVNQIVMNVPERPTARACIGGSRATRARAVTSTKRARSFRYFRCSKGSRDPSTAPTGSGLPKRRRRPLFFQFALVAEVDVNGLVGIGVHQFAVDDLKFDDVDGRAAAPSAAG